MSGTMHCSELIPVVQDTLASVRRVVCVTVPLISVSRLFLVLLSRVLVWSSCSGTCECYDLVRTPSRGHGQCSALTDHPACHWQAKISCPL